VGIALLLVWCTSPATAVTASTRVTCGEQVRRSIVVANDLSNCRGHGLVAAAHDITIDLDGHTIDGTGNATSAGVRIAGFRGVVVRGGVIQEFGRGIWLLGADGSRLRRNAIRRSADEGIFTDADSSGVVVTGNTVGGSGIVSGSTWADGIDARGDGARISGNTVRSSRDDGIDTGGDDVRVVDNVVTRNGADGIDVDGQDVLVEDNLATLNRDDGIGVGANALQVLLRDNTANDNADLGIQPKAGTTIDGGGNRASGNGDARQCVRVRCS
jgi:parallel beta-helix repeat protein